MKRRSFLLGLLCLPAAVARAEVQYPAVTAGRELGFPRDHGRHADFRIEWWYITGWVRGREGRDFGVQITFFRNRPGITEASTSRFAPKQLLFAHAALADPAHGRLRHEQRSAREGFGLAAAADATTDVFIGDWSLALDGDVYRARVPAREFDIDLAFRPTQPILPQGERGFSRKGPLPEQASYYYSRPHLAVSGRLAILGREHEVAGEAWLDHEWSSEVMAKDAAGWDWIGINLDDGGAVMAFRMRDRKGETLWAGGMLRAPDGQARSLAQADIRFEPLRLWTSPRTGINYPVAMKVRAGPLELALAPLLDDQELDSRASTGTIYWEGAVTAFSNERRVGQGYLELTGYGAPLVL